MNDAGVLRRVVLGRRSDDWAGFRWSGAEPPGMYDPEQAIALGARWEGDELVTYDLGALRHGLERLADPWVPDQD
ncbi:MAG TPA: hypothetical protein VNO79_14410 [Actinomycetota bacterium]|nr:hypothetical protein [Actinomycetota bacterium]